MKPNLAALLFPLCVLGFGPPAKAASPETDVENVRQWLRLERFVEAESLATRLLEVVQRAASVDSLELARALDLVVQARTQGAVGDREATQSLAERALRLKEAVQAPHAEIATSLSLLGEVLRARGRHVEAHEVFRRALELRETGPEGNELAGAFNDVAKSLRDLGRSAEARPLFERALAIRERVLPPDHPDLAVSLSNLANVVRDDGDPETARGMLERGLAIRRSAFGDDHPAVARSLQLLAILMRRGGDLLGALGYYEEALAVARRTLPPGHPEVARHQLSLGVIAWQLADYQRARTAFEGALEIHRRVNGNDHPVLVLVLNNLSVVAFELGDPARAAEYARDALRIVDLQGADITPRAALSPLNNLGIALNAMGRHPEAEATLARAISMASAAESESQLASSLINHAEATLALGDTARARISSRRALEILEEANPRHPDVPIALENLARMALPLGETKEALELLDRAVSLRREILGAEHPYVARALVIKAGALAANGQISAAIDTALYAEALRREHFRSTVRWLPERQALRFRARVDSGLDLAVAAALAEPDSVRVRAAWDALIRSRALVLDEMATRQRETRWSEGDSAGLRQAVARARQRLAALALRGPGEEDPAVHRASLEAARRAAAEAEQRLLDREAPRSAPAGDAAGLDEVLARLAPGSGLVSLLRIQSSLWAGARYVAFVRSSAGAMQAFSLGSAAALDSLIDGWRRHAGSVPAGGDADERKWSAALRARLWDPIEARIGSASRIVLVADGATSLVNFYALRRDAGSYLIEDGPSIQLLSTERDLLLPSPRRPEASEFLVVGAPDFGPSDRAATQPARRRGGSPCVASLREVSWSPLPQADAEARRIEQLWGRHAHETRLRRLTGAAATESEVKRLAPQSRFLHLATHAYFLEACGRRDATPTRGVGGLVVSDRAHEAELARVLEENPLLRSGLVLAGANRIRRAERLEPGADDGLLTAAEIAGLDLGGIESAVLSGCDTGVGVLEAGEGVFGLRRAFEIAGARGLVLTLWPVDDEAAREWVEHYYDARLAGGRELTEAAHEATRSVLAARRAAGRSDHPFYWAAFIATGIDRPLSP